MTIYLKNKHTLQIKEFYFKCCIGKKGITRYKREGDLKSPRGIFEIEHLYYRKDRLSKPQTSLKLYGFYNVFLENSPFEVNISF